MFFKGPMRYLIILFFLFSSSLYADEVKKVSVAIDYEYSPLTYKSFQGKPEGLLVEFWKLWSKKSGIEVEFKFYDWDSSINAVKNGEVIFHSGLTQERDWMVASKKIYEIKNLFYKLKDSKENKTSRVGLIDSAYSKQVKENFPDSKIVIFDDYGPILRALLNGEIDSFFDDEIAVDMFLIKQGVKVKLEKSKKKEYISDVFVVTNKANSKFIKIFNEGLAKINQEAFAKIEENILGHRKGYYGSLVDKTDVIILTVPEKEWLQQNPIVKVANEMDWPPFDYNEFGVSKGFSIDYFNLLAEKIGFKIEYIKDHTWSELLLLFEGKKIDIMPAIYRNTAREEFTLFTAPYYKGKLGVFTRIEDSSIQSIDNMLGKRIGIQTDDGSIGIVKQYNPELQLVELDTNDQLVQALATNKVDAIIGNPLLYYHYAKENQITNIRLIDFIPMNKEQQFEASLHIGVRKDSPILLSILQKAMAIVSDQEMKTIENKWIGNSKEKQPKARLTQAEEKYLKKHPVIRVSNETEWVPFNFVENGQPSGFSIDYMNLLASKIDVKVQYITGPTWDDFIGMIKNHELDVMLNIAMSEEREKFLTFSQPYISMMQALYTRDDHPIVLHIEDLNGKTFAVPKGYYIQEILKAYPEITVFEVANTIEAAQAVSIGKADAMFELMPVVNYIINQRQLTNLKVGGDIGIVESKPIPLHIGTRIEDTILSSILQKGMEAITPEELNKLQQQWLPAVGSSQKLTLFKTLSNSEKKWLSKHRKIKLGIDPAWPPFEFFDDKGNYSGISSSYIKIAEQLLSITMEPLQRLSWSQVMEKAKTGNVDILPSVMRTKTREKYLNFTKPYISMPIIIASSLDAPFIDSLSDLAGLKTGVVKDYITAEILERDYPDFEQIRFETLAQGLEELNAGRIDAFFDNLGSINYEMNIKKLTNIKIVAPTKYEFEFSMAVRKDWPEMVSILNKVIDSIEKPEKNRIKNTWMAIKVQFGWDIKKILTYAIPISVSAIAIIIFVVIWNRRLGNEITVRKKIEAELKETHRKVTDSIKFASLIQNALLPEKESIKEHFDESFIIWEPKDVVGGDIFFFEKVRSDSEVLLMVIDCTGHGVPGALVTALVKAVEQQVVAKINNDKGEVSPAEILSFFNRNLKRLLKQESEDSISNAGFDGGVLYYNKEKKIIRFAGAETSLFLIQNQEFKIIKGNRHSIGYKKSDANYTFTDYTIDVDERTFLYLTTDGFLDQNGGKKGFPFGKKQFKQLLLDHYQTNFAAQKKIYLDAIRKYQGSEEKNDDMTFVGLKIG